MQPDLPWNVAGIPPEAREAARAAARREGLSVGEWLTRRILRSFGELGDPSTGRESWRSHAAPSNGYGAHEEAPAVNSNSATARDSEDMLARVSRSENETQGAYRRIEEQLKGVGRRLEATERSQSENNRAMTKAATEINIAAREQAQAFDQLGSHVVSLNERLQRVERSAANDGLKDAVKALHQGLSRVADQIAETANQSASQIASLANNVESVAGRLNEARRETEITSHNLEERIATMDERVRAVERAAYSSASTLERTIESIEKSQAGRRDGDSELHRQAAALTQLGETLDRLNSRLSASEAQTGGAMARLEESVANLEARNTDPGIDRRLHGIETALADIAGRLETTERRNSGAHVEEDLRNLAMRVDAADKRHRDALSELRAAVKEASGHLESGEPPAAPSPAAAAPVTPPLAFDLPPFPEATPQPTVQPPPVEPVAAPPPVFDPAQFLTEPPQGGHGFGADAFASNVAQQASAAGQESFLAAARRSARAAAAAEAEQAARGGFSWGFTRGATTEPAGKSGSTRFVLIAGIILLVVIAIAAGVILSRGTNVAGASQPGLNALLQPKPAEPSAVAPQAAPSPASPSPAGGETSNETTAHAAAAAPPPARRSEARTHTKPVTVRPAPSVAVPSHAEAAPEAKAASISPMQRLAALANSGNAEGELLLGLAYLDGQGTAVNEAEAARWLERAADQGNAIAAYRLGTLYERGHGVPANAAKSAQLYAIAAKAGNRKAMHNLAVAYAQGAGVPKNYTLAAQWFARAANLGLDDSQFNLAVLYERGMGVPQSLKDAYKWYAIAAAQGDAESKVRVGALSSQISPADRAAAQAAAQAFHPQPLDRAANFPPDLSAVLGG
jgi:localization factor PodJL